MASIRITGVMIYTAAEWVRLLDQRAALPIQTNGITPVVAFSGSGSNLPYVSNSAAPGAYNGQSFNYNPYHETVGGSYQWNLQVQRELGSNFAASLRYVGSHGHNLPFQVDINQVPESPAFSE